MWISQTILKAIGLERLLETQITTNTWYIINVPEAWLSFAYPLNLESMTKDPFMEFDGAETKVRTNPLYVWWISGEAMIQLTQKPYHIVDGIDDYSITLEEKNAFLTNGTCPRKGRVCTWKKIGNYDVLYTYGIDTEGTFINMHIFILASDSFIYMNDTQLQNIQWEIGKEDIETIQQKMTELWLNNETAMYNEELTSFKKTLYQQKIQNLTWALLKATQYAQTLIDSMQYMTGFELVVPEMTWSELTGTNGIYQPRCTQLTDCGVDYRCSWTDNNHTQCIDRYKNTCSPVTLATNNKLKTYRNDKYNYELQYPNNIHCEEAWGIDIDPRDAFCCNIWTTSLGDESSEESAFVCIEGMKINTAKKEVQFHDYVKMWSYTTLSLQSKDISTSINEEMIKLWYASIQNPWSILSKYNVIGFTKTEQNNKTNANRVTMPFMTYVESHFFVNKDILYSILFYYDVPEECDAVQPAKIAKLRNIFNSFTTF